MVLKVTVKYSGVAKRKDGEASIELSDNWNFEDTHIWIYLTSSDRQINSDSICVKWIFYSNLIDFEGVILATR
jgi:hypothetical protein